MNELKLKRIVHSEYDNTIKYIFYTKDDLVIEFSYINKNDGKDIICVPSMSFCSLSCRFCHTTEYIGKIKTRNLRHYEITEGIDYIYTDLKLGETPKTLLISYMGIGEPILNVYNMIVSMCDTRKKYSEIYTRFAIATSLPQYCYTSFFEMVRLIDINKLPVKLHISLHYTNDEVRKQWMPKSMNIKSTIVAADFFKTKTGNPVEIHYTLLDGINDTDLDAMILTDLIRNKEFNVKFLFYNKKESINVEPSDLKKLEVFKKYFDPCGISYEYYKPPGLDIGASCGMFQIDEYIKK